MEVHSIQGTGYMVSRVRVFGFKSMEYTVSELLGYRDGIHSFSLPELFRLVAKLLRSVSVSHLRSRSMTESV